MDYEMDFSRITEVLDAPTNNLRRLVGIAGLDPTKDLAGIPFPKASLADQDLSKFNLSECDLVGANLAGTNLTGANLSECDLTGANLTGANLTGANLTGANLTGANLTGANLTGANLAGTILTGAIGAKLTRKVTVSHHTSTALQEGYGAKESYNIIPADKVEGSAVYNMAGDKVGKIRNVMIDKLSGKVAHVTLAFGGVLGVGERYHELPWNVLTYNTDLGGYQLDIDREKLEAGPAETKEELIALTRKFSGRRLDWGKNKNNH